MGYKLPKDTPAMQRDIDYLLQDLCVDLGYCIPPISAETISKKNEYSAVEFASEVLKAEGLNPEYEKQHMQRITKLFKERFGSEDICSGTYNKDK